MKIDKILLDHGSGGKSSHNLIVEQMLPAFDNPMLSRLDDGAVFTLSGQRFAFSTDSYVVNPIFFRGGCIGDLAVNGTVNDLAMCGATPLYLSAGLILEEGFPMADMQRILKAMADAAKAAGVQVVTGDTKVVPRGAADKIFINTSGIGIVPEHATVSGRLARPGDQIILSGSIADHGISVFLEREDMGFHAGVQSDTAALNHIIGKIFSINPQVSGDIHVLRDPTRGGLGGALNEIAQQSRVGVVVNEQSISVRPEVAAVCELVGFDPLYIANEGKFVAFVSPASADAVLREIRKDPLGKDACIIGEVVGGHAGRVVMQTRAGGRRIVDMPTGDQLPRIC